MADKWHIVRQQAGRYLAVGFSSAAIELVVFIVLDVLVGIDVRIATMIALACSTVFNFIMSWSYTFKSASNLMRSLILYLLLFAFNQAFSAIAIVWLLDIGLSSIVAKMVTMACIVLWNFVLYRKVVFK
jgi:putative flippase GtrA